MLDELAEKVKWCVEGAVTGGQVFVTFMENKLQFSDRSKEAGYPNFWVYEDGVSGHVRAYKAPDSKEFVVQVWRPAEFQYSGIPVFEPSGKKSF